MANAISSSEKHVAGPRWSLEEIREVTFTGNEAATHRLAGRIAPHLTWVFLRWNIAPNTITFMFIGCLVLASVVLALRARSGVQIVAFLIIASYILDCCDGPVARMARRTSTIGDRLDMMGHWFTNSLWILGATLGEIGAGGSNSAWLIGMAAMLGTNIYYYMQYNLMPYSGVSSSSANTGPASKEDGSKPANDASNLKRIRKLFHLFAPLDTNLLIVTSLIGLPFLAVQIWAVIANVATLAIFGQYYWRETH